MGKQILELLQFVILTALLITPYHTKGRAHKPEPGSNPPWAKTVVHGNERKTELQLFLHGVAKGASATVVQVVPAPGTNQSFGGFGYIAMFDDPLRVGRDPNSEMVGRAQGLEGGASMKEASVIMALTCTFSEGIYNGSSLSILGLNPTQNPVREVPVVGGTGLFRMARGYALIQTYFSDISSGILILVFNVTVFH